MQKGEVFSSDLAHDLWPRVWAWIKFLDEYKPSIPFLSGEAGLEIYRAYSIIIRGFPKHLINGTPGTYTLLTTAWKTLLEVRRPERFEVIYMEVNSLVGLLFEAAPQILGEMVESAGGNLHDLASLIVAHMKLATLTPHSSVSRKTLFLMLHRAILLVSKINGAVDVDVALISRGIIPAEVAALASFADATVPDVDDTSIEGVGLPHLLNILEFPPGYPQIRQALKSGLLRLILHRGQKNAVPRLAHTHVKELLTTILPKSTIFRSVLSQLRRSLLDVEDIENCPSFPQSDVFLEWTQFKALANERLRIMDRYDSGAYISWEACHNHKVRIGVLSSSSCLQIDSAEK
ncbi:hypothetical protein B0H11DRAFT_2233808 [Mycena galericulata]|nr:hypothetical protein B0H11DRAFT_2233808 [Mycena galericulata]